MLESVCTPLRRLVSDVLSAKIGVCARDIELVQVSSGRSDRDHKKNESETVDDHFILRIPISDQYLTWEVNFNSYLPNCPPDFDLNDVDFFYALTLEPVEELLPSLTNWNFRKEKALINVISELRSAYLKYQVNKLEAIDERFAYEYLSLTNERKFPADRIEVYCTENNVIQFLIKLEVNLPPISPSDSYIVLYVRFGGVASARGTNLYFSRNLLEVFGCGPELQRNIRGDESLADFVEEVSRSIEEQAQTTMITREKKRKQFILEMLKRIGHWAISYDNINYNHASFLMQKDEFVCTLEITLPPIFPSKCPNYRLISVYSTSNTGQPLTQKITPPYSENWELSIMVEQALNVIRGKNISQFRASTINSFKLF